MRDDGTHPDWPMVSAPDEEHTVPLAVEHPFHLHFLVRGRLGLFLRAELPGLHDIDRLDGATQQRIGNIRGRSALLP